MNTGTQTNTEVRTVTRKMPLYKVLLHNDATHDMLFVTGVIQAVFKLAQQECLQIMLEAHKSGVALCKVEPQEYAELHSDQIKTYGLSASIEPDD